MFTPHTSQRTIKECEEINSGSSPELPNTSQESTDICKICHEEIGNLGEKVTLTEKGCSTINSVSRELQDSIHTTAGDFVHKRCRGLYINKKTVDQKLKARKGIISPRKRRNITRPGETNSLPLCLFCGKGEKRLNKERGVLKPVRTMQFQETVLKSCEHRGDSWAQKVRTKIEFVCDCFASDTVYHNMCYSNFRSGLQIPKLFSDDEPAQKKASFGRPGDTVSLEAFHEVTRYLDSLDAGQVTVKELVGAMETFLKDSTCRAYCAPYLKQKLVEHYCDRIVFAQSNKKADVISLKRTADSILHDFFTEEKNSDPEAEKVRLIKTAAALIRNDIASLPGSKDSYPDADAIKDHAKSVPESLRAFLEQVTKKASASVKTSAIAQAIVQLSRPNTVIAPLQFGLAVLLHRSFGSRFLVDTVYRLGFCSSYTEVRKFELNAALAYGMDLPEMTEEHLVQFIADNVDHNSVTLDGRGTFHGMGIIATVTPGVKTARKIPRREVSLKEIQDIGKIQIHFFRADKTGLSRMIFKALADVPANDDSLNLDLLSKVSWPLKNPCPAWNGMMQMLLDGNHPGKSSFTFLPMIDLSSSDMSCIYSMLRFVSSQAQKNNATPILTFDQPLYMKALAITNSEVVHNDLQ